MLTCKRPGLRTDRSRLLFLLTPLLLGGCLANGPEPWEAAAQVSSLWYSPSISTGTVPLRVAVLPFDSNSADPTSGRRISSKIAAALSGSGGFAAFTRENLDDVLLEHELALAGPPQNDFAVNSNLKPVDLIISGACHRYEADVRDETRLDHYTVTTAGPDGRPRNTTVADPYVKTQIQAFVECNVTVIDARTGRQIAVFHETSREFSQGSPPRQTPAGLLRIAEDTLTRRIVDRLLSSRNAG